jgi:hypothetical protein
MHDDIGLIMVGRMDTRVKIERLTEIFTHFGNHDEVKSLKNLSTSNAGYSRIRLVGLI